MSRPTLPVKGGAPSTTTTLAGPTTTLAGPSSSGSVSGSTSTNVGEGSAGGDATTSTSSESGGGASLSSAGGGGGSTGDGGGGAATTSGTGGEGAGDVACADNCVPNPTEGLGGGGPEDGPTGDCDGDNDPNETDCQPCDPLAKHGQADYFDVPYKDFPSGSSYDYNCSGGAQLEYDDNADGCAGFSTAQCPDEPIYSGAAPACGEAVTVRDCTVVAVSVVGLDMECGNMGPATNTSASCH